MLVLSRRRQEAVVVVVGGGIERLLKVVVMEIAGGRVKLGFEGDTDIPVHRLENWERLCAGESDAVYPGKLEGQDSRPGVAGNADAVTDGMLGTVALVAEVRSEQRNFHKPNCNTD